MNGTTKNIGFSQSGFAFSLAMAGILLVTLVFAVVRAFVSSETALTYLSYALPSLALALSAFFSLKIKGVDRSFIKNDFNFKFKKRYLLVVLFGVFGVLMGLGKLNDLFIEFLGNFGYTESGATLPERSFLSVALCCIFIGVLPPVVEEVVFRSIICGGLKKSGYIAIIVTAALFSVYHGSPSKTVYQLLVGGFLCLVYLKSGSVMPSILIHSLNNLIIVFDYYFGIMAFYVKHPLVFSIVGLALLGAALSLTLTDKTKLENTSEKSDWLSFFMSAFVGIVIGATVWIASLIS